MWRIIWARILYMWGSLHRNFGNRSSFNREHQHAVRRFSQAYEMDPDLREARLDRGILLYRELGKLDEAKADFDALLDDDPDYGPALLNRALLAQEQGQYALALADLDAYLVLPQEDDEYRRLANRTAAVLREIVAELEDSSIDQTG
jgi:tetratricopeptide (TPR) repeat protein